MQKTVDALIGENKSATIKDRTILHTLSTIRYIIDASNKLNKNISVISSDFLKFVDRVDCDFIFSALQNFWFGDKFIHIIKVTYTNIQSKTKINGLLYDLFTLVRGVRQGVQSQCCYTLFRQRYLPISLMLIKELKEYKQEAMWLK